MRGSFPRFAVPWLLLAAGLARAAEPAPDLGAEAELHFDLGVEAYSKGDYTEALQHLLLSNRLAANRKVVFNIARAYEGLGEPTIAWSHYADFATAEPSGPARDEALAAMERLSSEVALVRVEASVADAAIFVDRRDLGQRGEVPRTIAVVPGTHRIVVEAPGYLIQETMVDAEIGQTARVDLELEPVNVELILDGAPMRAVVTRSGASEAVGPASGPLLLPVGTHRLEVWAPGYRRRVVDVTLTEGFPMHVNAELERATGSLVVSSPVEQARLLVDGVPMGYAPDTLELAVGTHDVRVEAPGFRAAALQVEVRDGETTEVGVRLVPQTDVIAASRISETLLDAPSTVVVISNEDIRSRGYTDLPEVVADLPGFDAIVANGVTYLLAYQRGYRTPQTQRTRLLTDGKDDSLMWSQSAEMSRQFPFTDIQRIEVLYGPASAVWGPNAFLGVINVVTVDTKDLAPGEHQAVAQVGGGSFSTGWVDGTVRGKVGNLGYVVSGRGFASEEPDFTGRWGFVSNKQLSDETLWGPLLTGNSGDPFEVDGRPLGTYADPTQDFGVRGRVFVGDLEVGASSWTVSEGYGPYYATDRAQPVAPWNTSASRMWAQYEGALGERVVSRTLFQRKYDRIWGTWAEASPVRGSEDVESSVSLTEWNAPAAFWEARQLFHAELGEGVWVQAGARWVRKELTKKYDVPGYWAGQFSSQPVDPGSGIASSLDTLYEPPPPPLKEMSPRNMVITDDVGGFGQLITDAGRFRFNVGVRYDLNSIYGGQLSPRGTAIWKFPGDKGALKLVYGHAFQEPSARQLWGEWDGRGSNARLDPETVDNGELVAVVRTSDALVEGSLFAARYADVLHAEGLNKGNRTVGGFEARARWTMANPFRATQPIDGYLNYTLTMARSSVSWEDEAWVDKPSQVGDIAPHKGNGGLVVPMLGWASAHARTNVVSSRLPSARNPLREQDYRFPAYALFDALVQVHGSTWEAGVSVDNVFDAKILQPGPEAATAGNDFDHRSAGYHNSALPLPGRTVFLTWTMDLGTDPIVP